MCVCLHKEYEEDEYIAILTMITTIAIIYNNKKIYNRKWFTFPFYCFCLLSGATPAQRVAIDGPRGRSQRGGRALSRGGPTRSGAADATRREGGGGGEGRGRGGSAAERTARCARARGGV